jgi:hypothetical protein
MKTQRGDGTLCIYHTLTFGRTTLAESTAARASRNVLAGLNLCVCLCVPGFSLCVNFRVCLSVPLLTTHNGPARLFREERHTEVRKADSRFFRNSWKAAQDTETIVGRM